LDSLNSSFRERAVLTQKGGRGGGGAALTPLGEELISLYRTFDAQVQTLAARTFRPLAPKTGRAQAKTPGRRRARAPVRRLSER
jgi:molybdate transport system regulatory protein